MKFDNINIIIPTTVAYIVGIIIASYITVETQYFASLRWMDIAFFLVCISWIYSIIKNHKISILLFLILIVFSGYFYTNLKNGPLPATDISRFVDDTRAGGIRVRANGRSPLPISLHGIIIDEPRLGDAKQRLLVQCNHYNGQKVTGKVQITVKQRKTKFHFGDEVILQGFLIPLPTSTNPNLSSFGDYLKQKGISASFFVSEKDQVKILGNENIDPIKSLSIQVKNHFIKVHQKTLSPPYDALLGSIIFGSQASPLEEEMQNNFKRAGIVHLLVVSGTQVSLLFGICLAIGKISSLPKTVIFIIATMINIIFTIMTGAEAAIVRSAIMAQISAVGWLFDKDGNFYSTLSLSALIILLMDPITLFNIGFQLSFAATWSLSYLVPLIEDIVAWIAPKWLATTVATSSAPTLATTPITIFHFSQLSLVAIVTNILVIPWVQVLVVLGFASTFVGLFFLPLAELINNNCLLLMFLLDKIAAFFAALPGAATFVKPLSLPFVIGYYVILIIIVESRKKNLSTNRWLIVLLVFTTLFFWQSNITLTQENVILKGKILKITNLDVGQGDSILIESPSGKTMLIDGGGRPRKTGTDPIGKFTVLPVLQRKGINRLDVIVLTHPHDDHVGGLVPVLESIEVGKVYDSGQPHTSQSYINFLKLIDKKDIPYVLGRAGQVINLGDGVKGYIIAPTNALLQETRSDLNNNSIVIKLWYKKFSILLTGDMEEEQEEDIIGRNINLKSDILKAGHHGSKTGSSPHFLDLVRPSIAIISCGKNNKFKHPHKITLTKLKERNIKIYRTDLLGAIEILTDGNKYIIKNYKREALSKKL